MLLRMRTFMLLTLLLAAPAGLAGQSNDNAAAIARLQARIDSLQAQLDAMRSELSALATAVPAASAGAVVPITPVAPVAPVEPAEPAMAAAPTSTAGTFTPRARTKVAGCSAHQALPDAECTPGAIMTRDLDTICHTTTQGRRDVTPEMEREAYAAYGVPYPQPRGTIELDHLISLELGGDNAVENLWPQFASPKPGFHEKDLVENELHKLVCAGQMSLADAQRIISTDWLGFYNTNMSH